MCIYTAITPPCPGRLLVLVVGLGNEIRHDDAAGLQVLDRLRRQLGPLADHEALQLRKLPTGGLDLIFEVEGFDRLIVVDTYFAPDAIPGRIRLRLFDSGLRSIFRVRASSSRFRALVVKATVQRGAASKRPIHAFASTT